MKEKTNCFLGLGANLPFAGRPPLETLKAAIAELSKGALEQVLVSGFYATTPVPYTDQPDFVNCVVSAKTGMSASDLLTFCQKVEGMFGRTRDSRWQARTLDIDILAMSELVMPSHSEWPQLMEEGRNGTVAAPLIIPHPRLHERAFALVPFADVGATWRHPLMQTSIGEMMDALPQSELTGVRRISLE